ncbi:MAG: WecB/TagA/CpsF family glycosyltransferase [Alphaproteobacteria bacterium]|nr:WecB/TagA/CpsF family glycosyltransferase [Alphaproteobacteria bacterium]
MVGGLKTVRLSPEKLTHLMVEDCLAARANPGRIAKTVFAANGHAIALAALDAGFRRMFEDADIVHADGQASVFAAKIFTSTPIEGRSATTDFLHDAARAAARAGLRFFLLGGTEEINRRCAQILKDTYPGLVIAGRRHGYFSIDEEESICEEINRSGADVLWTGLSVPLEYEFATRNKHRLRAGWIVTCGGCFNFVTGDYARAPSWMQATGFEWLYRLAREPKRLFWRYAVTNPVALMMLLTRTAEIRQYPPLAASAPAPEHETLPGLRRA